jgi:hypothetical protein
MPLCVTLSEPSAMRTPFSHFLGVTCESPLDFPAGAHNKLQIGSQWMTFVYVRSAARIEIGGEKA